MSKYKIRLLYLKVFAVVSIFYISLCLICNIYPFGNTSNLVWDLNIQYVDFFAYLRNVLLGKDSISFSMTKSLGGSAIALFGYYLSSPFNFLVLFFKEENFQMFIFVITLLKLGMGGVTFAFFIKNRFDKISEYAVIICSVAYICSQYSVGQMSNIMWMDGVYMLPLLMTGVWKFVSRKRSGLLYITVAMTVLFNWYTGYMNCLFLPFYFGLEEYLYIKKNGGFSIKKFFQKSAFFCIIEFLGVLLSSILFIPVVFGLLQGKGSAEQNIFAWGTNGKLLEIVKGFMLGNPVNSRSISLYCSLLILVLVVYLFSSKSIKTYEKIALGIMLIFLIAGCYFKPLENIWNGFRTVESYYYRFSYIHIAFIVYLAAYLQQYNYIFSKNGFNKIIGIVIAVFLICDLFFEIDSKYLWFTIFILVLYLLSTTLKKQKYMKKAIFLIFMLELIVNGRKAFLSIYYFNSMEYKNYVEREKDILQTIKAYDTGFYRMEQTEKRLTSDANVNAGMAYGYSSLSHYSSAFDLNIAKFMEDMGYSSQKVVSLYNEPILPIDSLLGVKYLLTDTVFDGFELVKDIPEIEGRFLYINEYALPLCFDIARNTSSDLVGDNVFEKINDLYSQILGRKIEILFPIEAVKCGDVNSVRFQLNGIGGSDPIFGIVYSGFSNLQLYTDNQFHSGYKQWLYQPVFNVGNTSKDHIVELSGTISNLEDINGCFYYLDLEGFYNVIEEIRDKSPTNITIANGRVSCQVNMAEPTCICFTVPYSKGWTVKINGEKADVNEIFGTFMSIDVPLGENFIELTFVLPGKKAGILGSIFSIFLYCCIKLTQKDHVYRKNKLKK